MEAQNRIRELVLDVMRRLEADVNGGIIPTPSVTDRIGNGHLLSAVTVTLNARGNSQLQTLSENVDIRQLNDLWRGEDVDPSRTVSRSVTTFTCPENLIVVRSLRDSLFSYSMRTQVIWNSRFTWREIKQHVEDNTYNFYFRSENIFRGFNRRFNHRIRFRRGRGSATEEVPDSLRVAVDGLPEVQICNESENHDDGEICPICHETFSSVEPAKQLPCKHLYHSKCIISWVRQKNSCPTCRCEPLLLNLNNVD